MVYLLHFNGVLTIPYQHGTTEQIEELGYRSGGPESGLTCGQIIEDTNTLHIAVSRY